MRTVVAISQPTYLPWCGYFNLILNSDIFVFLDDVQFDRCSWQQRNIILLNNKPHYLTVPVLKKGNREKDIVDVKMNEEESWRSKHLKTLHYAYCKHPFGKEVLEIVERELKNSKGKNLAEQNINLIIAICNYLGIKRKFIRSSELGVSGKRPEKLVNICEKLSCSNYFSAAGSKEYIEREGIFDERAIKVEYQKFICKPYKQISNNNDFVSHLSILDILKNIDVSEALDYLN